MIEDDLKIENERTLKILARRYAFFLKGFPQMFNVIWSRANQSGPYKGPCAKNIKTLLGKGQCA